MEINRITNKTSSIYSSSITSKRISDENLVNNNQDNQRTNTIEIMKSKGIELSNEKIEAVHLALCGTTLEDARKLNKVFTSLCEKADKDLEKFKDILADTITKTTIGLIKNGLDLKLSKTKILNQYAKVTTSMGGYHDQRASSHKRYTEIFKGHFIDEDDRLETIINSLAETKDITLSNESYLFSELKDRFKDTLDSIIDDMDSYEFSQLINQAILGADGELTVTETINISRVTSEINDFKKTSDEFYYSIKSLISEINNDSKLYPMLKSKLKEYLFFRESSSFLRSSTSNTLYEMIQATDDKDIEKLNLLFKELPSNHFSNSKYLEHSFTGPFKEKNVRPHEFENVANGILSLIGHANMNIKFDSEISEIKRYQRVTVWTNDIYSHYGYKPNPMSFSMTLSQDEKRVLTEHNKRIEGYSLLTTNQEYYGSFISSNDEMTLLDFQFKFLSPHDYIFNLYVSFFNTSPSLVSFSFIENSLNINIWGEESSIERVKNYTSVFEDKIKSIGSHKLNRSNSFKSTTVRINHHTVRTEESTLDRFQVTV